jgi:GTP-binding protein EngB required for normal cell division
MTQASPFEPEHAALLRDLDAALDTHAGLARILGRTAPDAADDEPFRSSHASLVDDLAEALPLGEGLTGILDVESPHLALIDDLESAIDTRRGLAAVRDAARDPADRSHLSRRQRERIAELVARFLPIGEQLAMTTRLDNLRHGVERVRQDTFSVLVMGEFNRGKSTLINALLGRPVLPARATESTSTICEVRFGESPRAVLYPREPSGAAPIETTIDALDHHVAADGPNPYQKVEVYWPAELCRDGVVLVDSPGLGATLTNEQQTIDYLRSADAVIFVLDSQNALSRSEETFVRTLPPGMDPFFVFNKIGNIDADDQDRLRAAISRRLARVRPAGPGRAYFLDALQATARRTEPDRSGVGEFSRDLQRFLATDRAAVKIGGLPRELAEAIREARRQIPVRRGQLQTPLAELEHLVEAQRAPLAHLAERRTAIVRRIDEAGEQFVSEVREATRQFLVDTAARVPGWAETAEMTARPAINPFRARSSADAFAAEMTERLQARVVDAFATWRDEQLASMVEGFVARLGRSLEHDLAAFETHLDQVQSGLLPAHLRIAAAEGDQSDSPTARMLAAATGVFRPGTAGAGTAPNAMLMTAAAGASLLVVTPVGMILAAATLAAAAAGLIANAAVLDRTLRTTIGRNVAELLTEGAADNAARLGTEIAAELAKLRDAVTDGLTIRLEEMQTRFDHLREDYQRGRDELSARMADLSAMEAQLAELSDETADLLATLEGGVSGASAPA